MAKLGVSELRNPWTDCHKMWLGWLRRPYDPVCQNSHRSPLWGRPGKWVKYHSREVFRFLFCDPNFCSALNLAQWRLLAFWTNRQLKFLTSRWRTPPSCKIEKNGHISAMAWPISAKLGTLLHIYPENRRSVKTELIKIQDGGRRQLTARPSRYRSDRCHACFSSSNMMQMLQLM